MWEKNCKKHFSLVQYLSTSIDPFWNIKAKCILKAEMLNFIFDHIQVSIRLALPSFKWNQLYVNVKWTKASNIKVFSAFAVSQVHWTPVRYRPIHFGALFTFLVSNLCMSFSNKTQWAYNTSKKFRKEVKNQWVVEKCSNFCVLTLAGGV